MNWRWIVVGLVAMQAWAAPLDDADRSKVAAANKFVERGNEFVRKNSLARAQSEYQRALQVFPRHVDALYNLAIVEERLGHTNAAVATYQRYLAVMPDDADVWTQLGLLRERSGDKAGAEADYRRALAADAKFGRARHNLGVLLQEQGRWDEAREHLEAFVKAEEGAGRPSGEGYYSLGLLELSLGRGKEAKQRLQQALAIDPDVPWYHNAMGDAYLLEKQPALAAAHFEKAIAKDSQFAPAYSGLGEAWAAQGDREKARAAYQKALALRPDYVLVHYKLGRLDEEVDPVAAIKEFESYLVSAKNPLYKEDASQRLARLKQKIQAAEQ